MKYYIILFYIMDFSLLDKVILLLLSLMILVMVSDLFIIKKEKFSISVNNKENNLENKLENMYKECTPENNCFKGSYLRSQIYTNVCQIEGENKDTKLTRLAKLNNDRCYRTLGQDDKFKCSVNIHGQRNCYWKK